MKACRRNTPVCSRIAPAAAMALWLLLCGSASADPVQELSEAYQRGLAALQAERFAEASAHLERAVALAPGLYGAGAKGPVNLNTARLREMLAACYMETLRLAEAEALFNQCVQTGLVEEGPSSGMAVRCKTNLGELYFRIHQWPRSETLLQEALRANRDRRQYAVITTQLGYLFLEQDRLLEAKNYFTSALPVAQEHDDRDARLLAALCQHGLGMVAHKQGDPETAERLFTAALKTRMELLPEGHRWIAHSKGMLAAVLASVNRDAEARPLLVDAERAMRAFWGSSHPDVAMELHELALLLQRSGDTAGAMAKLDESRRMLRSYCGQVLKSLSTEEQLRFLAEERQRFMDAVAVARLHPEDAELRQRALEWVINEKGLVQETLAERELLARQAALSPQGQELAAELTALRQQMVALATSGNKTGKSGMAEELAAREVELIRRMGLRAGAGDAADVWLTLPQVCAAIPDDGVLVEIVRLERDQPRRSAFDARRADGDAAMYLAWLLDRSGAVQLVELGPAATIDQQVVAAQRSLNETPARLVDEGEEEAERQAAAALRGLSERLLIPLLARAGDAKKLIVSPDGALWLVPWSALPLPGAALRYAVEELEISHVVSGRDLAAAPQRNRAAGAPIVLADPDYDARPAAPAGSGSQQQTLRGAAAIGQLPRFQRLPGTATEAKLIEQPLAAYAGASPRLLLREQATEEAFIQASRPSVAALCTHGFFFSGDVAQSAALENPLLQCGLLLAGCNERGSAASPANDGVLTGLEILRADLEGTRLVVLSACETALGDIRQGEGVAGLRQAFHLAGCDAVVASLWSVDDQSTAQLMGTFFRQLAAGNSPATALCEAQRAAIVSRRAMGGAAHPFFWAAFTLTGR